MQGITSYKTSQGTPGLMRKCGERYEHSESYNSWQRLLTKILFNFNNKQKYLVNLLGNSPKIEIAWPI